MTGDGGLCTGQDIYHQAEKFGSAHLVRVRAWHPEGKDVRLHVQRDMHAKVRKEVAAREKELDLRGTRPSNAVHNVCVPTANLVCLACKTATEEPNILNMGCNAKVKFRPAVVAEPACVITPVLMQKA
eukprot:COSAG02_NODE_16842_length_1051_cov_7.278361_1_plen_128_part_00